MRITAGVFAVLMIVCGLLAARYYILYNHALRDVVDNNVLVEHYRGLFMYSLQHSLDPVRKQVLEVVRTNNAIDISKTLEFLSKEYSILSLMLEHPDGITKDAAPRFKSRWLTEIQRVKEWEQRSEENVNDATQ